MEECANVIAARGSANIIRAGEKFSLRKTDGLTARANIAEISKSP